MKIEELSEENLHDINKPIQPFDVIGGIIPAFQNGEWSFTEYLLDKPYEKFYGIEDLNYSEYINNPNQTIYLCYSGDECVGQIEIKVNWNRFALIRDIAVAKTARGKGVGRALIEKAIEWAKHKNLCGLVLETQDFNLTACRFYHKVGFTIGAVDTMMYTGFGNTKESAIFWYMKF